MDAESSAKMLKLLESIDSKLDGLERIEDLLYELKMEVCGFEHEGTQYPGSTEKIINALGSVEAELGSIQLTLEGLEDKPEQES
ncbi:MAG TPA: hypothetical protein VGH19_12230 [Verrucomicrobiae bacterium]